MGASAQQSADGPRIGATIDALGKRSEEQATRSQAGEEIGRARNLVRLRPYAAATVAVKRTLGLRAHFEDREKHLPVTSHQAGSKPDGLPYPKGLEIRSCASP